MEATAQPDPIIELRALRRRSWGQVAATVALAALLPMSIRLIVPVVANERGDEYRMLWAEASRQLGAAGSSAAVGVTGVAVGLWVAAMLTDRTGPLAADVVQLAILRRLTTLVAHVGALCCWSVVFLGQWHFANALDQLSVATCAMVLGTLGALETVEAHERTRWIRQAERRARQYRETAEEIQRAQTRPEAWVKKSLEILPRSSMSQGQAQNAPHRRVQVRGPVVVGIAGITVTMLAAPARAMPVTALVMLYVVASPLVLRLGQEGYQNFLARTRTGPRARWLDFIPVCSVMLVMVPMLVLVALVVGPWPGLAAVVQATLTIGFFAAVRTSAAGRSWVAERCGQLERSARTNAAQLRRLNAEVRLPRQNKS